MNSVMNSIFNLPFLLVSTNIRKFVEHNNEWMLPWVKSKHDWYISRLHLYCWIDYTCTAVCKHVNEEADRKKLLGMVDFFRWKIHQDFEHENQTKFFMWNLLN